jgi:hypothetical protein
MTAYTSALVQRIDDDVERTRYLAPASRTHGTATAGGCVVNVALLGAVVASWQRCIAGGGCALVGYSIVRCTERTPIQVDEQFGVVWLSSAASLRLGMVIDVFPHSFKLCQPDLAQAAQQRRTVGIGADNLVQPRLERRLLPLAGRLE